jgi:plasmid stabilization system protein ParE
MRRVEIAPSFDREAEAIGASIELRFGEEARQNFVADLERICTLIAFVPKIGHRRHRYDTKLTGFPYDQNWIFFDFDDDAVHFLHIVDAKRERRNVRFERASL